MRPLLHIKKPVFFFFLLFLWGSPGFRPVGHPVFLRGLDAEIGILIGIRPAPLIIGVHIRIVTKGHILIVHSIPVGIGRIALVGLSLRIGRPILIRRLLSIGRPALIGLSLGVG